jgi:Fe-S-cluster-containing hydrogenase component 2
MKRKIIEINEALCNGCGKCVPACEEGAIQIIGGKAKLVAEKYCDGLGACLGDCPTGALKIVEREADDFDEAAVEQHLEQTKAAVHPQPAAHSHGGGCPGSAVRSLRSPREAQPAAAEAQPSELQHWPVQIRLVQPGAPFLNGADLLVTADCVPVACGAFHSDLLKGRSVMMGCPKFDDVKAYAEKFADIFAQSDVRSVTVAVMQVPCCQSLPTAVEHGVLMSGKDIPVEKVVISLEGDILSREQIAA